MILTGKCKKDFGKWIYENDECYFTDESMNIYNNALIIEFFDSVGIYINATLDETNKHKFKYLITDINTRHLHCWKEGVNKDSRQQATIQAIKKANDLYNERFSL